MNQIRLICQKGRTCVCTTSHEFRVNVINRCFEIHHNMTSFVINFKSCFIRIIRQTFKNRFLILKELDVTHKAITLFCWDLIWYPVSNNTVFMTLLYVLGNHIPLPPKIYIFFSISSDYSCFQTQIASQIMIKRCICYL